MPDSALYAAAAIGGAFGGWLFAVIWRRLAPMDQHRKFWAGMHTATQQMLTVEETADFLRVYKQLALSLGGYLGRNIGGLILGCLPVAALAYALYPVVFSPWDARAETVLVEPADLATLSQDAGGGYSLRLEGVATALDVGAAPVHMAACWQPFTCLLLRSLNFTVVDIDTVPTDAVDAVVVRADKQNWNPFFPYLNDLEFVFFCTTVVGAVIAFVTRRKPA